MLSFSNVDHKRETRTGGRAWSFAWVIADRRGRNSASARFFSAMNDPRYDIFLDGERLIEPISQLTAEVLIVSQPGCITDYIESLRLGAIEIPLRKRPMISMREGTMRLGKHVVEIREKLPLAA